MKPGDQVVLKQINKHDTYYRFREELIGETFTVNRVGTYWGGGWRSIGLRGISDILYLYKARVVKAKKEGLK